MYYYYHYKLNPTSEVTDILTDSTQKSMYYYYHYKLNPTSEVTDILTDSTQNYFFCVLLFW